LDEQFQIVGADNETTIKRETEGLRITFSESRKRVDPAGVLLRLDVPGDFEVTAGYEILQADRPIAGHGVGFEIYLTTATLRKEELGLSWLSRVNEGEVYVGTRATTGDDGKPNFASHFADALAKSGRMRVIRCDQEATFFAAEDSTPFRKLFSHPMGPENLRTVRLAAFPGWKRNPVDIRIKDLHVRALSPDRARAVAERVEEPVASSKGAWAIACVIVTALLMLTTFGVGAGLMLRARRRASEATRAPARDAAKAANLGPGSTAASFSCAGLVRLLRRPLGWSAFLLLAALALGVALTAMEMPGARDAKPLTKGEIDAPVRRLHGHTGPVHNVRFAPGGRLVSGSGWPESDQTVRIWDLESGQAVRRVDMHGAVHSLDIAADGHFALVGLNTGQVAYLDLEAGQIVRMVQVHGAAVGWVAFAPDGARALSTSDEGTARLWKLADGEALFQFRVHSKQARAGALLRDGRRLLTGDSAGMLQIWDLTTGAEVKQIPMGGPWMIDAIRLSADGRQALVAGVAGVRVHDLESGNEVRRFQEESEEVHQADLSPDGRWLLTGGFDGNVRLWDFATGELIRRLGSHDGLVFTVAFSPDGRRAASGGGGVNRDGKFHAGTDHDIRVWDLSALNAAAPAEPPSEPRSWLVAAAALLFLAVALLACVAWRLFRRGDRAQEMPVTSIVPSPATQPDRAMPAIVVACPGCGRNLKAQSVLAGRRVRCPQCGQGVRVPAVKTAGSESGAQ
jgi:hypothetical protein